MANDGQVLYEYPFSERIRTLLRLEDLFDKLLYFCEQQHSYCHHTALLTLFEILEVTSRADLKSDLLQELERHRQTLQALRNNPQVSEAALVRGARRDRARAAAPERDHRQGGAAHPRQRVADEHPQPGEHSRAGPASSTCRRITRG